MKEKKSNNCNIWFREKKIIIYFSNIGYKKQKSSPDLMSLYAIITPPITIKSTTPFSVLSGKKLKDK